MGGILDCEVCTTDFATRQDSVHGDAYISERVGDAFMVISKATHRWQSVYRLVDARILLDTRSWLEIDLYSFPRIIFFSF